MYNFFLLPSSLCGVKFSGQKHSSLIYILPAHCLDITAGGLLVQHTCWSGGCVEYG